MNLFYEKSNEKMKPFKNFIQKNIKYECAILS